jgi:predicted LPLAT superfamily acyltransferase
MSGNASWEARRERSNAFWVVWIAWIARYLGRSLARLILWPIVAYFLCFTPASRRASRDYLQRALKREPGLLDIARHYHCFAACTLDRVLLLGKGASSLNVRMHRPPHVRELIEKKRGCLLLVCHHGSFEAMRVLGQTEHHLPIRIVLDRGHGPVVTKLLERLNPELAATVIDATARGPDFALALRDALAGGYAVGLMADRIRDGEPSVGARLLGSDILLPSSPWIMAAVLKVPVLVAFCLYRGGRDYDAYVELLSEQIELPRQNRQAAIQQWAQRYTDRLAHYIHEAPYNWFNFYPFWIDSNIESEK